MNALLAVLLHLHSIQSPGAYSQSEIDANVLAHEQQVQEIYADLILLDNIITEYQEQVRMIEILDLSED